MTISEMKGLKQEYGLSNEAIADETGVPYSTVCKIMMGVTKAPRRSTVEVLTEYFRRLSRQDAEASRGTAARGQRQPEGAGRTPAAVRDGAGQAAYSGQRPAGAAPSSPRDAQPADRSAAPQPSGSGIAGGMGSLSPDHPAELIGGTLFSLSSPGVLHQELVRLLSRQLEACTASSSLRCRIYEGPLDVVLSEDPETVVRPDLFVICDEDGCGMDERSARKRRLSCSRIFGAPLLVIEVLSPATKKKDSVLKLQRYLDAGVAEYWMVDPDSRKVFVYDLRSYRDEDMEGDILYLYRFDETVPVRCLEGSCGIDFPAIQKDIDDYYS